MIQRRPDDVPGPAPELLAAYADGELSGELGAEVEAWLADHPEAADDVTEQRRLARLCKTYSAADPAEAKWDAVLARIEAALPVARARPSGWRRLAWIAGSLAVAASLMLAVALLPWPRAFVVALFKDHPSPVNDGPKDQPAVEPFPVMSAADVEITSMHDKDRSALIIGEPPVREPLALLLPGEVDVNHVTGDAEGMDIRYHREGSDPPMIIMVPREAEREAP